MDSGQESGGAPAGLYAAAEKKEGAPRNCGTPPGEKALRSRYSGFLEGSVLDSAVTAPGACACELVWRVR